MITLLFNQWLSFSLFLCCLSLSLLLMQRRGGQSEREMQFFGSQVNNLLCSGRLKLVSIDTCYLSADSTENLIKCKNADGGEPKNHYTAITSIACVRSFYCHRVKSLAFVPHLVMMSPFSSAALSLFSRP